MSVLTDPGKNRGGAFTEPERTLFGLKGLLPPGITTLRGQEALLMSLIKSAKTGIEKHRILQSVKVMRPCNLFFRHGKKCAWSCSM